MQEFDIVPTTRVTRDGEPAKIAMWATDMLDLWDKVRLTAVGNALIPTIEVVRRLADFVDYEIKIELLKSKPLMTVELRKGNKNPIKIPKGCERVTINANSDVNKVFTFILHQLEKVGVVYVEGIATATKKVAKVVAWLVDKFDLPLNLQFEIRTAVINEKVKPKLCVLIEAGENFKRFVKNGIIIRPKN